MPASSRSQGSCSNTNIHCSSSSKHPFTLLIGLALQRLLPLLVFRAIRKICPTVPAAVYAALFSKEELTTFVTPSQCSLVNRPLPPSLPPEPTPERTTVTQYHILSGGHWLPPSSGASGSPTLWVSCQLRQLYSWPCFQCQLSCCSHWTACTVCWTQGRPGTS